MFAKPAGLHRARGLKLLTIAFAIVLASLAFGVPASPSLAHDQLLSQSPAAGEHVESAPASVRLSFSAPPLEVGMTVLVIDADAKNWAAEESSVDGVDIVTKLDGELPDGNYQVRWRAVSGDGHTQSGSYDFAVGDLSGARAVPVEGAQATSTADSSGQGQGDFDTAGAQDETSSESDALRRRVLLGVAAAVAAGAAFLGITAIRSRRRARSENGHAE